MQQIEIGDQSLRLDYRLINRSPDPMPAGLGVHPWFIKPVLVAIRGDAVHPMNSGIQARAEPVAGPFDLRALAPMPPDLDATWTELGTPQVELEWPAMGVGATMRITAPTIYVVAASPANRDAVAVEPQTHAVQGLWRLLNGQPGGLTMLDPERELALSIELAFERIAPSAPLSPIRPPGRA
jgi:aldose 1-epimerase